MSSDAINYFNQEGEKVLDHLRTELSKLQTGRASAALVEHLNIEMYGQMQPLKNIAGISIPDAKTISISPWDKGGLAEIEKAIMNSDLGLNPNNNGESIILNLPPMTEERRRDIVKIVKKIGEDSKVAVRQVRQKAIDKIKAEELPEDQQKGAEKKLQEHVDTANKDIEEAVKKKEEEVMTI